MAGVRALQDGVFRCLCPAGSVLAADGLSCVPASGWSSPSDGTVNFSFLLLLVVVVVVVVVMAVVVL